MVLWFIIGLAVGTILGTYIWHRFKGVALTISLLEDCSGGWISSNRSLGTLTKKDKDMAIKAIETYPEG